MREGRKGPPQEPRELLLEAVALQGVPRPPQRRGPLHPELWQARRRAWAQPAELPPLAPQWPQRPRTALQRFHFPEGRLGP